MLWRLATVVSDIPVRRHAITSILRFPGMLVSFLILLRLRPSLQIKKIWSN